jgi:pimeloyl-ACP methyl ester carboxylesterase
VLAAAARPERVRAMVLIAPAPDFTEALMKPRFHPEALRALEEDGVWREPSDYDPEGYPITRLLIEDGARWSVLPGPLGFRGPVRILQGARDDSVPWTHAHELVGALASDDVVFTLIKDGDHRLSRPQDLERLVAAVEEVL